ncbi:hypothetical protein POX_d06121 [Penicillium oxalicum]|uniref:hypothetical protein n=1 Tax=Penicillium oxalicum TaxID=69781 RepID=UPI0020B8F06C|nr:hypothetical protein POX_d06121 [Penicillium oxalicum]KAI2790600.1 hypothetical protein POX_d06121 [Penicillium oxalicum]
MKTFNPIFICLFALLSLCFALPSPNHKAHRFPKQKQVDLDNYTALTLAAAEKGVELENGKRYGFREKWATRGATQQMCYPGYSHVRLIVGQFFNVKTRSGRQGFDAKSYEMISAGAASDGHSPMGGTVESHVENMWWANHYFDETREEWVHVSKNNEYEFLGETTASDAFIVHQGLEYARLYPTYNLLLNNCMSYTKTVWEACAEKK